MTASEMRTELEDMGYTGLEKASYDQIREWYNAEHRAVDAGQEAIAGAEWELRPQQEAR